MVSLYSIPFSKNQAVAHFHDHIKHNAVVEDLDSVLNNILKTAFISEEKEKDHTDQIATDPIIGRTVS